MLQLSAHLRIAALLLVVVSVACDPRDDPQDASHDDASAHVIDGGLDAGHDGGLVLDGGEDDAGAGAAGPDGGILVESGPCTTDVDCVSGACAAGACRPSCEHVSDCPALGGWSCADTDAERGACVCAVVATLCGDDLDSDCDGAPDPCLVCDGHEIADDDDAHCGACGRACPIGSGCIDGVCRCALDGAAPCAGACPDTRSDPAHCGACGNACAAGASCVESACVCPSAQVACGSSCVDLSSDRESCGACGVRCPPGAQCVDGGCVCDGSLEICGGACVDVSSSREHCGACGAPCGATCIAGRCLEPIDIGVGENFTCVLLRDGSIRCWGATRHGALGDGLVEPRPVSRAAPAPVVGIGDAASLHVGPRGACAIRRDGSLWCWGQDGREILLDGAIPRQVSIPGGVRVVDAAVGGSVSCAVLATGALHCWTGHPTEGSVPAGLRQIAAGTAHACVMDAAGGVWCWGDNRACQSGLPQFMPSETSTPTRIENVSGAVEIAAGREHTCARTADGGVWCWGASSAGQLGYWGGGGCRYQANLAGGEGSIARVWTRLAIGAGDSSAAIHRDRTLYAWGRNGSGQLGDGTVTSRSRPLPIRNAGMVRAGAIGLDHGCVITTAAEVLCWGMNNIAQLGGGTTESQSLTPVRVRIE